jgi:hypothetical protein
MISQPDNNVQYIATQDFLRTLLSGNLPADLVALLEQIDLITDPGVDEPNAQGLGHPSEQAFLDEYRSRRREITAEARQLEMRNPNARAAHKALPYHLIAMALRHSPEGKKRVILTNDEGLMEWMHFFGIETIDSESFVRKLEAERVVDRSPHMHVDDDKF